MKIIYRLAAGFWILLFIMGGLSWISISEVNKIGSNLSIIKNENAVIQRHANNYLVSVEGRALAVRDIVIIKKDIHRKIESEKIAAAAVSYSRSKASVAELINGGGFNEENKKLIRLIDTIEAKTVPLIDEIVNLAISGDEFEASSILLNEAKPLFDEWLLAIHLFINQQENANNAIRTGVIEDVGKFRILAIAALLIAFVVSSAVGYVTCQIITRPIYKLNEVLLRMSKGDTSVGTDMELRKDEIGMLARSVGDVRSRAIKDAEVHASEAADRVSKEHSRVADETAIREEQAKHLDQAVAELSTALEEIAKGNLTYRINEHFVDKLDSLRVNFNRSIEALHKTVEDISSISLSIDMEAKSIHSGANSLSLRTEQQAATVEETAAALDEISSTVADSNKRAEEAGRLVSDTKVSAEKSGAVVKDAISAMNAIHKSTSEVANIIGVIDEIAFQTNLLALNAGVEAARAGDAGRGFAVVAQEVRALAQKSANAAKEIKTLIKSSNEQVKTGVALVGNTGEALSQIVTGVQEVNRHVQSIVEASREQKTALAEVNSAVNMFDQSVQQNASMAEETNAECTKLGSDADQLSDLVLKFKI